MLHFGPKAHSYLFVAVVVLFSIFLLYVYFCKHQKDIHKNKTFSQVFSEAGLNLNHISHDDSIWFFKNYPTCVGYGEPKKDCPYSENFCAGNNKYGSYKQQALAVKKAITNGGEHPECPLLYPGAP